MRAIVLAGGRGTRLAPFTHVFPKPMMPIGDRTILEILLRQMKSSGITHVTLAVGYLAGLMSAYFQDGARFDLDIDYAYESKPLGTAGPLSNIEGLSETFVVTNGDILTLLNIADLVKFHKNQNSLCTIAMHERKVQIDLGVIEQGQGYEISGYIEKPAIDFKVSMGIYVFEPGVLKYIPKDERLDFPDLVKTLIAAGERVVGYPYSGYWQDLGSPGDYAQATQDFETMRSLFIPEEK